MNKKEKIKLLTDFNAALENQEIKAVLSRVPSGDVIWGLFEAAINAKMDSLLVDVDSDIEFVSRITEARDKACQAIEGLVEHIDAIKNSPVMNILNRMGATLAQAGAAAPQSEQAGQPQPPPVAPRRNPEGRSGGINGLI